MPAHIKIKKYLESKGISQAYLSRETGIAFSKLNLSLNGFRKLTIEEYETICFVLGVEVGTFLEARAPQRTA